jgi:uncharacterized protein (DUF488 family)
MSAPCVFTIGHSRHSLERFVELLAKSGATAIADVRSVPYSRFQPHFNRSALSKALKANGIAYVFLGHELGARSDDPSCYIDGRVQYSRLAAKPLFQSGIERVLNGMKSQTIALMCAEKEPLECHRTLLVGRALDSLGVGVTHIHADGRQESHSDAMFRLLDLVGLPRADLFRSPAELVEEAYAVQESRTAYVKTTDAAPVYAADEVTR